MKRTNRKDSIIKVLTIIYTELTDDLRNEISSTINDLAGKYSESKNNHKAYAEYISIDAESKLRGMKFKNESALHKYIGKNFRHEHVVPKNAIRLALEYWKKNPSTCTSDINEIMEAFSGCAIILPEEDKRLHRKTHNNIDNKTGKFCLLDFDKEARYLKPKDKGEKIQLKDFNPKSYLSIPTSHNAG